MLKELTIENLAIIEKVNLEFNRGMIVLTGETGAGKSIILNGINLLIGERSSADMIRDGADYLQAQGVFEVNEEQAKELRELGIEPEDGEVIVRRHLDKNGKGKAYVNNVRFPLNGLKEIMGTLVDIVGQHAHQMLLNKTNHIKLIDKFLGDEGKRIKENIQNTLQEYNSLDRRINDIENSRRELLEKKDFYEFQLEEIDRIDPKLNEDEKLEEEYRKLFNAGKIKEKLFETETYLKQGEINALNLIYNSRKNLENISKYGKEFQECLEKLEKIYYDLQDCFEGIESISEDIDIDDRQLEKVVSRLDSINRLKGKYGNSIEEILEYRENIFNKLKNLDENEYNIKKFIKDRDIVEKRYWEEALHLREIRKTLGEKIEKTLGKELEYLNMQGTTFKVKFEELSAMSYNGSDSIEFMISTNLGQGIKPLWKIASGGEVSRIMLALKTIFSKVDNVPVLIFDEIDTGVGGETVRKIATKLKEIGKNAQVMCITHSPAIAARADQQLYIEKKNLNNRAVTTVSSLTPEERVEEIARMLAGKGISDSVVKHAKELLNEGEK